MSGTPDEGRLADARRFIAEAQAAGPETLPPPVLARAHRELLQHAAFLLAEIDGRGAGENVQRRILDEAIAAYGESLAGQIGIPMPVRVQKQRRIKAIGLHAL